MILVFLLFPLLSFSHITQDDVAITDKTRHSLKIVCQKMVPHDSPLIEVVSGTVVDCMGRKVLVDDFCTKAMATDPYYLRGYVDKEKNEVVCVSGKKVIFKYLCVKLSDKELCSDNAKKSCEFIKQKLAKSLDIVSANFSKNSKGIKELNCQFESLPLNRKM